MTVLKHAFVYSAYTTAWRNVKHIKVDSHETIYHKKKRQGSPALYILNTDGQTDTIATI